MKFEDFIYFITMFGMVVMVLLMISSLYGCAKPALDILVVLGAT